jgi:Ca2+-binding EF-hand superfamily protein
MDSRCESFTARVLQQRRPVDPILPPLSSHLSCRVGQIFEIIQFSAQGFDVWLCVRDESSRNGCLQALKKELGMTGRAILAMVLAAAMAPVVACAQGAFQEPGQRIFSRVDSNGDGVIDRQEVLDRRGELFDRMDSGGDGGVTREEVDSAKRGFRKRLTRSSQSPFDMADADGNGTVTREEFLAAPQPIFDQADSNRDGQLTPDEFTSFVTRLRESR